MGWNRIGRPIHPKCMYVCVCGGGGGGWTPNSEILAKPRTWFNILQKEWSLLVLINSYLFSIDFEFLDLKCMKCMYVCVCGGGGGGEPEGMDSQFWNPGYCRKSGHVSS